METSFKKNTTYIAVKKDQFVTVSNKYKHDYDLESLRGIAALLVVVSHALSNPLIDPHFMQTGFDMHGLGHNSVLVFFILSGYVIGLSTKQPLNNKESIFAYLKKRIVRLYPIYIFSICLSLLVSMDKYSLSVILGHLTFTQIITCDVITVNGPLWSLNYEVIFYLLYIPISFFGINPLVVAVLSFLFGLFNYADPFSLQIPALTSYAFGFSFWCVGLIIFKYFKEVQLKTSYVKQTGAFFLFLALALYNVFPKALSVVCEHLLGTNFSFPNTLKFYDRVMAFEDFAMLPFGIFLVLTFSGKEYKFKKVITIVISFVPLVLCLAKIVQVEFTSYTVVISFICYFLSVYFTFFASKAVNLKSLAYKFMKLMAWAGSVSYAVYLTHYPILSLVNRTDFLSGTFFSFFLRATFVLATTFGVSYFLERKVQPLVKAFLFSRSVS